MGEISSAREKFAVDDPVVREQVAAILRGALARAAAQHAPDADDDDDDDDDDDGG